ncbi:unnamed protein product [Phyllotreta striolata]|uniref:Uncharacterized protein n=1 Tax=Phyllotreta striolata TaxID=444603 RepID=A0A9N9TS74_PHYSR|nr:unnamed protein product [Phyllotreta striolata]
MIPIARPAPFILKPLAGLYNPFAPGCSLLCNHPAEINAKELVKNAKTTWNSENRNLIPIEGHDSLLIELTGEQLTPTNIYIPQVDSVPEELFRRYTDTDSRPQTPAPTLASGLTRLSTSRTRRCLTPDPIPTSRAKEKTRLILDLRRSHSQEILSVYGGSPFCSEVPEIRIDSAVEACKPAGDEAGKQDSKQQGGGKKGEAVEEEVDSPEEENEEFVKRRGKKRRKKSKDLKCPITYQASTDPETQVATIGLESVNVSARHSIAPDSGGVVEAQEQEEIVTVPKKLLKSSDSLEIDSYLPKDILKQLRRELDYIVVDNELNLMKRRTLEEALKAVLKDKSPCEELDSLKKEMKIPPVNDDLWISLPRIFSRSSAIFQLPMDSETFATMTPIEYTTRNVKISSSRKLLYSCIFQRHKVECENENGRKRYLNEKKLKNCLDLVMGMALTEHQFDRFKNLVEWNEEMKLDFKQCCGLFALCERILSPEFHELSSRNQDPCHEIETADFEYLELKLQDCQISENLKTILYNLKTI